MAVTTAAASTTVSVLNGMFTLEIKVPTTVSYHEGQEGDQVLGLLVHP